MSTLHISPQPPRPRPQDFSEYLTKHRATLTKSERKYVDLASGWVEQSGKYYYEPEEAYAEIALGGSLVTVKPERPTAMGGHDNLGAERGVISGFSSASRRRLMRMIASTNREDRPIFVTLTYPDEFSDNPGDWKRDIDVFGKRFRRNYNASSFVWRIEFKERKSGNNTGRIAPHIHLLVWSVDLGELREWCDQAWYNVVNSGDERHLRAGVSCELIRTWNGTMRYVSKYITKVEQFPLEWQGRSWGIIGKKHIPWATKITIPLTNDVAVRAVRLGRKMIGMDGKVLTYGMTWIMNGERMLDYIEYSDGSTDTP